MVKSARPGLLAVLALLCLALLPASARAAEDMPKYLQDLDRAYRSGDWVLQCDSARVCRILGVVRKSGRGSDTRAVVTISRGIGRQAQYHVRFAFIDDHGFDMPPPDQSVRLYTRGQPRMLPPVPLQLGAAEGDARYPQYRTNSEQAWRIVSALRHWPRAVLRGSGGAYSNLPMGNLDRLLRRMDRMQRPLAGSLSPAEEARWMKEYHYTVVRSRRPEDLAIPDDVMLACDSYTHVNSHEGWQVGPNHILWIAHCPEGAKIFLGERLTGADGERGRYRPPVPFHVRDAKGRIRPAHDANFDSERSLLQLMLEKNGRWDCGHRLQLGYLKQGGFGLIEDRRMPMCRGLPSAYWLLAWSPTSWKLAD